mgnify:CR=1 FL=1
MSSEERIRALSNIRSWVLMILLLFVVFFVSYLTRTLTLGKWWLVHGWWIPLIYILLLLELIRRVNPRLAPNKAQLSIFMFIVYLFLGKWTYFQFTGNVGFMDTVLGTFSSFAKLAGYLPTTRPYYTKSGLPSWLVPTDESLLAKIYDGIKPGESIDWYFWIGPIAAWSLIFLSTALMCLLIAFTITGPRWAEEERLLFPVTMPTTYLINTFGRREGGGRWELLNLREAHAKIFWIGTVIGFLATLPFYYRQVFAPWWAWAGGGLGFFDVAFLADYTRNVLPGAYFGGRFSYPTFLICLLLPYDLLISAILAWLIFQVIYPLIAVYTGVVPYSPGVEKDPGYFGYQDPFPFMVMIAGFLPGLGLFYLWSARDRIKALFSSLIGREASSLHGISLRWCCIGLIASIIVWLSMWILVGMHPAVAVCLLIFFILCAVTNARGWAEFNVVAGNNCLPQLWMLAWPIGPLVGAWSWTPPQVNRSLFAFSVAAAQYSNCIGIDNTHSIDGFTLWYKVAYETDTDMRDALIFAVVALAIMIPFMLTFNVWFNHHIGFKNLAECTQCAMPFNMHGNALNMGITSLAYWLGSVSKFWGWTVVGAILSIIIAYLRTVFPWFILNPIGLMVPMAIGAPQMGWLTLLSGLALKIILSKALGVRRLTEYTLPLLTGLMVGQSLLYIVCGAYFLSSVGIPNFISNWR